jgi:hypothetical protein
MVLIQNRRGEDIPARLALRVVISIAGGVSARYQRECKKEELMSTPHFPAVGHVYEAHFGSWVHHLHFASETVMTLTNAQGPFKGASETVQIAVTPIRPGVFLICWQEADKTTVVHVEDFASGIVHTHITEPNGIFIRHSGILTELP